MGEHHAWSWLSGVEGAASEQGQAVGMVLHTAVLAGLQRRLEHRLRIATQNNHTGLNAYVFPTVPLHTSLLTEHLLWEQRTARVLTSGHNKQLCAARETRTRVSSGG